jgi:hypothetical protein
VQLYNCYEAAVVKQKAKQQQQLLQQQQLPPKNRAITSLRILVLIIGRKINHANFSEITLILIFPNE